MSDSVLFFTGFRSSQSNNPSNVTHDGNSHCQTQRLVLILKAFSLVTLKVKIFSLTKQTSKQQNRDMLEQNKFLIFPYHTFTIILLRHGCTLHHNKNAVSLFNQLVRMLSFSFVCGHQTHSLPPLQDSCFKINQLGTLKSPMKMVFSSHVANISLLS